jgi:hypothetical protein
MLAEVTEVMSPTGTVRSAYQTHSSRSKSRVCGFVPTTLNSRWATSWIVFEAALIRLTISKVVVGVLVDLAKPRLRLGQIRERSSVETVRELVRVDDRLLSLGCRSSSGSLELGEPVARARQRDPRVELEDPGRDPGNGS